MTVIPTAEDIHLHQQSIRNATTTLAFANPLLPPTQNLTRMISTTATASAHSHPLSNPISFTPCSTTNWRNPKQWTETLAPRYTTYSAVSGPDSILWTFCIATFSLARWIVLAMRGRVFIVVWRSAMMELALGVWSGGIARYDSTMGFCWGGWGRGRKGEEKGKGKKEKKGGVGKGCEGERRGRMHERVKCSFCAWFRYLLKEEEQEDEAKEATLDRRRRKKSRKISFHVYLRYFGPLSPALNYKYIFTSDVAEWKKFNPKKNILPQKSCCFLIKKKVTVFVMVLVTHFSLSQCVECSTPGRFELPIFATGKQRLAIRPRCLSLRISF